MQSTVRGRSIRCRRSWRYFGRAYAESGSRVGHGVVWSLSPCGGRAKYQSGRSMDASGPAIGI